MARLGKDKSDIITTIWMREQFDQIDTANKLILQGIKDIKETLDKTSDLVTPELERAVKQVAVSAVAVDKKVPDTL